MSMAALEDAGKKKEGVVGVMIVTDKAEFLLCSLSHRSPFNQPLDLNFTEGEEVTFFINGEGTVHLTGYQLEDESNDFDDYDDMITDSDEDDDAEVPSLVPAKGEKRKGQSTQDKVKKMKMDAKMKKLASLDDDDDDDDDDFEDKEEESLDEDEVELDDDDDMEDDDDDDDDDEDEEEVKPQKKSAKNEISKVQTQTPDKSDKKKKENKDKPKTPAQEKQAPQTPSTPVTPGGDGTESSKKKKKKKKKNKNKDSDTPGKPEQQNQQKQSDKQQKTPQKKVLGGGVVMEEFNPGNGPVAQKGKMMHVYYVGKLQKDGKQFDSCTSGKPFKFRLGFKEVIPGWDKGLEGMKVGGKRRLIVPPKEGYGNQKQGPIPPNSTLVFDIELKSVS